MACQLLSESTLQGSLSASSASTTAVSPPTRTTGPPSVSFVPNLYLPHHQRLAASRVASLQPVVSHTVSPSPCQEIVIRRPQLLEAKQRDYGDGNEKLHQTLLSPDQLVEQTICDIVAHLHEAPFLHLFLEPDQAARSSTVARRQHLSFTDSLSSEEKWKTVRETVDKASPSAVILVHRLEHGDCNMKRCYAVETMLKSGENDDNTNFWGVLVLGKSITRSACYILNTTSVASASGGICTAFSLTKAKCFGPSWHDQMQRCWLL